MTVERIVAVGASAGGVEALQAFAAGLPADLDAAVVVVLHIPASGPSVLPAILSRAGALSAAVAQDGEELVAGQVYVAAADRHLTVMDGVVKLTSGPKENGVRPAVDVLFRSVAEAFGPRAIGVVLSGTMDDGAAGLLAIRRAGGVGVVQSPEEALYPSMPKAALATAGADETGPAHLLGGMIQRRMHAPDTEGREVPVPGPANDHPSPFGCPDCGGVLWQEHERPLLFRCRVGHRYAPEALLAAQRGQMENALWAALRVLEERVDLTRRLGDEARASGRQRSAQTFDERAAQIGEHAAVLREMIEHAEPWQDAALETEQLEAG